jgi:hypothetical protein
MGSDPAFAASARKLANKILANASDAELDPLRRTMQLDHNQYLEGIFCWKAFLYYKWRLMDLLPQVAEVSRQIDKVRPRGVIDQDTRELLTSSRETIRTAFLTALRRVRDTLAVYDNAYQGLTQRSDPIGFRTFLLNAPSLFSELGDRLGAVDHVISFWRFRFPEGRPMMITGDELADILTDFEYSLNFQDTASFLAGPTPKPATASGGSAREAISL